MGLLQKLLSTLGLRESSSGRGSQRAGDTTVTVEHEPDTRSESAVKGTGGVSEDTAASGSTGTITDTADEEGGATEPSEAAGTAASDGDEEGAVGDEGATVGDEGREEEDEATAEPAAEGGEEGAAGSGESPDVLNGIGPAYAERLENAGVDTVADLAEADAADLAEKTDLGEGRLANWIEQAREY